jgi:hypothetical protein
LFSKQKLLEYKMIWINGRRNKIGHIQNKGNTFLIQSMHLKIFKKRIILQIEIQLIQRQHNKQRRLCHIQLLKERYIFREGY